MRGKFITFEGGEGTGKSTQTGLLAKALEDAGIEVLTTREPGGTQSAEEIRALLLDGELERWHVKSEAFLHFVARIEHLDKTILPALEQGTWVISDRFSDSTLAYQGAGHGIDRADLLAIKQLAIGDFAPDLTLLLDLPPDEGLARAFARAGNDDRYERRDLDFHIRIRNAFLDLARQESNRMKVVDANQSVDGVQSDILLAVTEKFKDVL